MVAIAVTTSPVRLDDTQMLRCISQYCYCSQIFRTGRIFLFDCHLARGAWTSMVSSSLASSTHCPCFAMFYSVCLAFSIKFNLMFSFGRNQNSKMRQCYRNKCIEVEAEIPRLPETTSIDHRYDEKKGRFTAIQKSIDTSKQFSLIAEMYGAVLASRTECTARSWRGQSDSKVFPLVCAIRN